MTAQVLTVPYEGTSSEGDLISEEATLQLKKYLYFRLNTLMKQRLHRVSSSCANRGETVKLIKLLNLLLNNLF